MFSKPVILSTILATTAVTAVDLRFYTQPFCAGSISSICPSWNPNSCCGDIKQLWTSVNTNVNGLLVTGTSGQNGNPCNVTIGTTNGCFTGSSQSVQGAWYAKPPQIKGRDVGIGGRGGYDKRQDDIYADSGAEGCAEPSLVGYEEAGMSYEVWKNGTAYKELSGLAMAEDDEKFGAWLKEHAERIIKL